MIELLPFFLVVLYFLPFMVAAARDHESFMSIFLVNTFLGWTGIGWLFAFAWAYMMPAQSAASASRLDPRLVR